ncbi:ABC transporter ATP-binding protein, partial [Vibrio sp. 10N.222.49.C9]
TLLLVSHDREFVDNTVMASWIFEGNGRIEEFVGGYHDAQQQRDQVKASRQEFVASTSDVVVKDKAASKPSRNTSKKLSYKLQRELESLPQLLEQLEEQ